MRYKHSTPRNKVAVRASCGLTKAAKGLFVIGFWIFLTMAGNFLTECWR
ncbi:MAG: hypothetical protein PHE79_09620 [Eubacteriales bacterium]|nr:hypothetical protein [Eubacteriales bacterium]